MTAAGCGGKPRWLINRILEFRPSSLLLDKSEIGWGEDLVAVFADGAGEVDDGGMRDRLARASQVSRCASGPRPGGSR